MWVKLSLGLNVGGLNVKAPFCGLHEQMLRSTLSYAVLCRVAEPENLKTVPVPTFYLNTVPVPVPVPALVPGHIHAYIYTYTYMYMCISL